MSQQLVTNVELIVIKKWKKIVLKVMAASGVLLPIIISVAGIFFIYDQNSIAKKHNRLSVKPILQITPYIEGLGKRNGLYLSNDGFGPAIINGYSVKADNIEAVGFESDRWKEILTLVGVQPSCFGTAWPRGITTIKPGAEIPLVFISPNAPATCLVEMVKLVGGKPINIEISYESLYEEKFTRAANSSIVSDEIKTLYQQLIRQQ